MAGPQKHNHSQPLTPICRQRAYRPAPHPYMCHEAPDHEQPHELEMPRCHQMVGSFRCGGRLRAQGGVDVGIIGAALLVPQEMAVSDLRLERPQRPVAHHREPDGGLLLGPARPRPERRAIVHQLAAIEQREGGVVGPLGHVARELEALGRTLPRGGLHNWLLLKSG